MNIPDSRPGFDLISKRGRKNKKKVESTTKRKENKHSVIVSLQYANDKFNFRKCTGHKLLSLNVFE